jgi:hypothetical protein
VSPQSSVAFHPAVIIVVLRWYASNKLMFGAMPRKIPGVWGQSPQGAWGRIRKLSDFRIGSLAFPLDGRSSPPPPTPPAKALGARGSQAVWFVFWVLICRRLGAACCAAQTTTDHGKSPDTFLISAQDPLPLRLCAFAPLRSFPPAAGISTGDPLPLRLCVPFFQQPGSLREIYYP